VADHGYVDDPDAVETAADESAAQSASTEAGDD
jgi:hypothetical protein